MLMYQNINLVDSAEGTSLAVRVPCSVAKALLH